MMGIGGPAARGKTMRKLCIALLAVAPASALGEAPQTGPAAIAAPRVYRCALADGTERYAQLPIPDAKCALAELKAPPGWTWVAGSEGIAVFTHSALGKPPPGLVKVWVLYSFDAPKGPPGKQHLSAKSLEFHSCEHGTFAVGTTIKYSRAFGEGEIVESTQAETLKQMEIPPDTASAWVWKSVCAP
jgi:hypothetical protein